MKTHILRCTFRLIQCSSGYIHLYFTKEMVVVNMRTFEITGRQCSSGSTATCRLLNVSTHHRADELFKANTGMERHISYRPFGPHLLADVAARAFVNCDVC